MMLARVEITGKFSSLFLCVFRKKVSQRCLMKLTPRNRLIVMPLALALLFGLFVGFTGEAFAASPNHASVHSPKTTAYTPAPSNTAVLTYKYNNLRTGQTTAETTLTPGNVNVNTFGKRMTFSVDGQIYAQPLYVPNLTVNGQPHNVVIVATEHDSVYAFDADSTDPVAGQLWHINYLTNGATTPSNTDVNCNDTIPEMGITGTPVIDPATNIMYVVAFTKENGNYVNRLHAIDITTGQDAASIKIQANVSGVSFDALHERQRAGLLLANGKVYIAWGSFCDHDPYHGWLMSYSYDATAKQLNQVNVFNDSPDSDKGGIWGAGGAIAADNSNPANIYFISGNGTFNKNAGGHSYGDSVVKLDSNLNVLDYFTPFNQQCLDAVDADFGSSGPLLEPTHNVIVAAGKEGRIFVINRSNMGKYNTIANVCSNQGRTDVDNVMQESGPAQIGGLFNTPTYWNNGTNEYVYLASVNRSTGAYKLNSNGTFSSFTPTSKTPESFSFTGGNLVVSGNGTSNGILWTLDANGPTLRAYDASNLGKELYNSNQYPDRDALGGFVKFTTPIIANGEVFVPGSTSLTIYGAVSGNTPPPPASYNNVGISDDSINGHRLANFDGGGYSYSSGALSAAKITPGSSVLYNGVGFIWPNLPPATLDNFQANGQTVSITPAANATTLAFLGSATDGNTSGTATLTYTDGSTSTFTLGLSDWANGSPAFGNKIVATMGYRNGPNGKQFIKIYLFYTDVALAAGKTLKSVTLPTAPGGKNRLHIFAFGTKGPLGSYNNIGTSDDSNTKMGNFDGSGNSYSAEGLQIDGCNPGDNAFYLGTTGAVFQWPAGNSGDVNNYIANGQTLAVNAFNNASLLAFAGASSGGPSSGTATINYSDNSHQTFTLGFSDWTLNGGKSQPGFGNGIMYAMPYRNTQNGHENVKTYVFFASVALQQGKTVVSVTLPQTVNQGQMHIFAVTTKAADTGNYNNIGTTDDSAPNAGGFDSGGRSYSAQALQAAGIMPWQHLNVNGVSFTWPNIGSGQNNNYSTNGVQIPAISISPVTNATTLAFLGSASNGPSTVVVTINYSDGSSQTVNVTFSDWTLGGGKSKPVAGNSIAITTAYRNKPSGRDNVKTYVFYTQVTLQTNGGKTVTSISIAPTANQGQAHIFAIGTK
jgi:hypothetical protein